MNPDNQTAENTDRELWRETAGDYYSNSIGNNILAESGGKCEDAIGGGV